MTPTTCYTITVILDPQPEGGYTVTCEELPELITEGDSVDEALNNSVDAFVTVLELYEDLLDAHCLTLFNQPTIPRPFV